MTTITLPSVQSLLIEMISNGQPLATGTGFVVESPKGPAIVTNWHNITGLNSLTKKPLSQTETIPDEIRIIHNRKDKLGEWLTTSENLFSNGNPLWFEHPTLGDKMDVVAILLTNLTDVHLYPYQLVGNPQIAVLPAEPISVVGFPFGLQAGGSLAVWATGFVASEPAIDFNALPIFLIDCRTRPGQSGSAVIAHRNGGAVTMENGSTSISSGSLTRFLGVYSGRINAQSDIGMVWKAKSVSELITSIK